MIQLPHVNPPPIAHKATRSFFLIFPFFIEDDNAKGIDAAGCISMIFYCTDCSINVYTEFFSCT